MTRDELIRVGVFLWLVGIVYSAAVWLAIRSIMRRLRKRPPAERAERRSRLAVYALAILGFLCFGYGYFSEPYSLQITRVRIESTKLAAGTTPIRLALFSDLHSDPKLRLEKRLAGLLLDLAQHKRMSVNSCLEEILLHTNEGVEPHTMATLRHIQELKKKHGIDYDSHGSYRFVEE